MHSEDDVRSLAGEIAEGSKVYAALLGASHPFWADYPAEASTYADALSVLQLVQVRPLLLSVLKSFSSKDVGPALRLLVSCCVRLLITGKGGGGFAEDMYGKRAKEIASGQIKTPKQLLASLTSDVPQDPEFENRFASATSSRGYLARYYLRALETDGVWDVEKLPNPSSDAVSLEHILPESSEKWPHIAAPVARSFYNRLGNLTLLQKALNKNAQNFPFKDKLQFYKQSEIGLTKELTKYTDWGPDQIEQRQKALAKRALKTWPLSI